MRKTAFFLFACLLPACAAYAQLQVSNNPTGAAVVITQPSAVAVVWSVGGTSGSDTVVSEEGLFVLEGETLGRVDTLLTTTTSANGAGSVNETLLIPPDVVNRAYKRRAPTFFYRRQFRSSSGATGESALTCRVATSAYGNFSVASITLYFDNERGQETFAQNDPTAHAFAEVHYNGSGLLKGVWEVQEPNSPQFRVLQQVNYHLAYGDRIVFQSPPVPPLPTIVTGQHQLRFSITQPVSGFPIPTVSYFVKVKTEEEKAEPALRLEIPPSGSTLDENAVFRWNTTLEKVVLMKFSVSERANAGGEKPEAASPSAEATDESNPLAGSRLLQSTDLALLKGVEVFSAALPADAREYHMRPGQLQRLRPNVHYLWQVQALDASGKVLAQTELRLFQIK